MTTVGRVIGGLLVGVIAGITVGIAGGPLWAQVGFALTVYFALPVARLDTTPTR